MIWGVIMSPRRSRAGENTCSLPVEIDRAIVARLLHSTGAYNTKPGAPMSNVDPHVVDSPVKPQSTLAVQLIDLYFHYRGRSMPDIPPRCIRPPGLCGG